MLFKYKPKPDIKPEDLLGVDLVNAGKITSVSENTSDDIQDYDLVLDGELQVVLYKENCDGKIPEVGDYFYICHKTGKFLWKSEDFESIFIPVDY